MDLNKRLEKNIKVIEDRFDGDKTFDFTIREFKIGNKDAALAFVQGFNKDEVVNQILAYLMYAEQEDLSVDAVKKIIETRLPVAEADVVETVDDVTLEALSGPQVLLIDGEDKAIVIDARTWEARGPEEPELEKATRGSEDGFVETMMFNIQLIRRRIRDVDLRVEALQAGKKANSDIAVVYMKDYADLDLVEEIKERIDEIDVDGLPLADRTIEDYLTKDTLSPLPKVRYTNRPDIASAHIMEGKVCVVVDNSPTVLILPATFFDHTQNLEEYRQSPVPGTYFNLLRLIAVFIGLILPPLWLLIAYGPAWVPEALEFIGPKDPGTVPLGWQFVIATVGIDLIRIASIQTPTALATSLSLIAALILGEFSVETGLFDPETILYLAIGAISNFALPGYELSLTLSLMRFGLILLVVFLRLPGLIAGLILSFLLFALSKSFGTPYLWPLIPFDWSALKTYLFRQSVLSLKDRRRKVPGAKDFE
ncbi:spore germination protein [Natroniella sulfidigena]|uniref:spore germination protein n=1 Tax=Natroniella sulfidigena TaxID=723921 RepID=UPI002009E8BA|nr:spore germination protein [Natroniella sulfidigena]MCK8816582.1 spore germination protein [Natroniella sulfidigena]